MTRKIVVALVIIAAAPALNAADVLTWHNDLARTGQNLVETVLTPANVNPTNFGRLFIISVDGQIYAQPLIVAGLSIPGQGVRDVLYIATEHGSVYACDANDGSVLWSMSMSPPGETPSNVPTCGEVTPELGITATPVIDRTSGPNGTIYVVAMSKDALGNHFQRLHALDLKTGAEQFGGPVNIAATYPGTGDNSDGVNVIFDPKQHKERAGLVLTGGIVYLSWASHCDIRPYTGWVIGYDKTTLAQVRVLNLTPNGNSGAFWAGGAAPAVDAGGNIYAMTGNGSFETSLNANGFPNNGDYGNCFVKLSTTNNSLQVFDYWTMFDTVSESHVNLDLGSGGPILLPDMVDTDLVVRHLAVGAGKDAHIYIVDRDSMGKFNATSNSTIYQDVPSSLGGRAFGGPAYFNGMLYFGAVNDNLRAFAFTNARLNGVAVSASAITFPYPGTIPSVSANGLSNGIVWALEKGTIAVLHAYDATDLAHELYNSSQAANSRDEFGAGNKFSVPTIANGKVYVASTGSFVGSTDGRVTAFGLLNPTSTATPTPTPGQPPAAPANLVATAISSSQIALSWTDNANNETGFRIQRSNNGVNFTLVATLGANVTTYTDNGLTAATTYYYRARAYNSGGNSALSNVASATTLPSSTPTPTPTATPTSSPTPTPTPINISGTISYCSNPVPGPVSNVTLTLTGTMGGSTLSDGSGNYALSSLPSGGNYTVTATKAALAPASSGINTVDVIAIQRHILVIGTPLSGCKLTAADVNGIGGINTVDVVAVQRFAIGVVTGTANTGQYKFTPASRAYPGIVTDQTAQNYDALIFGDVAPTFVDRPGGPSQTAAGDGTSAGEVAATVAAVALPEVTADQSKSNLIAHVTTTAIDAKNKLVGFQGDFTFDERVVSFQSEPVRKAGLTAGNWNVTGNVLAGAGPIRTLRISAYSNDFTALSGSGTLFELRMTRVSKAAQSTPVIWAAPPNQFIFIDADLKTQKPGHAAPGSVTTSGKRK